MSRATPPSAPAVLARQCPDCGYDLRNIDSTRCPECGWVIDSIAAISPIPWQHRRGIGNLRALWRTVLRGTFRPRRLFDPNDLQLSYAAARRFRWAVVIVATLPAVVLLVAGRLYVGPPALLGSIPIYNGNILASPPVWQADSLWIAGITCLPAIPAALALTLALATAMPAVLCRPARLPIARQNRAVALVAYGSAPLAWLALPVACIAAILCLGEDAQAWAATAQVILLGLAGLLVVVIGLAWEWATVRLLALGGGASVRRQLLYAALLPALWLGSAMIGLVLFPMVVGLLRLMYDSMR